MSKFSERLSSLGQTGPAKMGFGKSAAREKNPVMLVIGRNGDQKSASSEVDLVIAEKPEGNDGDWGLLLASGSSVDVETLQDGCQFVLIESENVPADVLLSEELGLGLAVEDSLSENRIRAIEDGPFDFLLYTPSEITWPLTVGSVLKLQDLVSSFSKHIFLSLPSGSALPGEKDLEVLKNLPVSALVVDLSKAETDNLKSLKVSIARLEPRKPSSKGDRSPLVPFAGRDAGDEADDSSLDDDDEWDD